MPRSVGYNSIAGWQIFCFPTNYYEQNLQKKNPNKQKNPQQTEDLLQLHFNYDWSRRNKSNKQC